MDTAAACRDLPGTYDPEPNLNYWGTGSANPVSRGWPAGSNLWTATIVAVNADTGKMAGLTISGRRTTPTIGTPRKRPSSSTASSGESRAS